MPLLVDILIEYNDQMQHRHHLMNIGQLMLYQIEIQNEIDTNDMSHGTKTRSGRWVGG